MKEIVVFKKIQLHELHNVWCSFLFTVIHMIHLVHGKITGSLYTQVIEY